MGYLTEQIADEVGRVTQERGRQYFTAARSKLIDGVIRRCMRPCKERSVTTSRSPASTSSWIIRAVVRLRARFRALQAYLGCVSGGGQGYLRGRASFSALDSFAPVAKLVQVKNPNQRRRGKNNLNRCRILCRRRKPFTIFRAGARVYLYHRRFRHAERRRLVIDVAQRERRNNGLWGKLKPRNLA